MKKDRWGYGSLAIGLLLLCLCVIGNDSFVARAQAVSGRIGLERLNIGALASAADMYGFSLADMEKLPKAAGSAQYAYSGATRLSVSAEERTESVEAIGVGGDFFAFHQADMADGTTFTSDAVEQRIAVLDSELAWRLFRAQKVSGMTFKVGSREFTVGGVLSRDETVYGSLVDIGVPRMYLPFSTLAAMEKEARISNIELHFEDVIAGEGNAKAEAFLQEMGKSASSFRIADGYEQARAMSQWGSILVFILWLALTLRLMRWYGRRVYAAWSEVRLVSARQGVRLALKRRRAPLVLELIVGLGTVGLCVGLFLLARFAFYIPTSRLPAELFDVGYYVQLFGQSVRDRVFAASYTPMWWSAYTDMIADTSLWLFIMGLLGWMLFLLGNALLRRNGDAWTKKVSMALCAWLLGVAASCGIVALCGVTPALDMQAQIALFACTTLFLAFAPPWRETLKPNTEENGMMKIPE